jgi:hypothetical protein
VQAECFACATASERVCANGCKDLETDSNNCGGCGTVCPAAVPFCVFGVCELCADPSTQLVCGGVCVEALTDPTNCGTCGNTCAPGQACVGGNCSFAVHQVTTL